MRYYIFVEEEGSLIPSGRKGGYKKKSDADDDARRFVDDALPRNRVLVMLHCGTAFLRGDGEVDFREEQV